MSEGASREHSSAGYEQGRERRGVALLRRLKRAARGFISGQGGRTIVRASERQSGAASKERNSAGCAQGIQRRRVARQRWGEAGVTASGCQGVRASERQGVRSGEQGARQRIKGTACKDARTANRGTREREACLIFGPNQVAAWSLLPRRVLARMRKVVWRAYQCASNGVEIRGVSELNRPWKPRLWSETPHN